jgi:flagellar biosynthesis/type III secretory pathway protein FliH
LQHGASYTALSIKGDVMKSQNLLLLVTAGLLISSTAAYAQQANGAMPGPMMAGASDAKMAMMQEPNKAMAQASVLYMTVFTKSLQTQSSERRDKIDSHYIKAAFAEMKRAHSMIEGFQAAHVKTMDAEMKESVKMMMTRMNSNIAEIQKHLDVLENEVNGKQNLDIIAYRTDAILKHLDDMPKPGPSGMGMPGGKPMMQ